MDTYILVVAWLALIIGGLAIVLGMLAVLCFAFLQFLSYRYAFWAMALVVFRPKFASRYKIDMAYREAIKDSEKRKAKRRRKEAADAAKKCE